VARAKAARNVAARTNQTADWPSAAKAMPEMKNTATASCAMVSAAAFRTDMNG